MIPRLNSGTSFKGAGLYYLHDKGKDSSDRVAWTYSVNTLHDDPEKVIGEMQATYYDQNWLKQQSGNRGDGRPTKNSVMTIALAWSPEQNPDKRHMIETGHSYLQHMGWEEHQALFVAHNDTKHPHMHIVLNRIHPETGMTLDDNWSKTRSQQWALEYEKENGKIYCQERAAKYEGQREAKDNGLNYAQWQTWEEIRKTDRFADPEFRKALEAGEWESLKKGQRDERDAFWKETGQLNRELRGMVWESVKEEFAPEWSAYKEQQKEMTAALNMQAREDIKKERHYIRHAHPQGAIDLRQQRDERRAAMREELAAIRRGISERQKGRAAELGEIALEMFSEDRAAAYELLKAKHREEKTELRADQKAGVRRPDLLNAYSPPTANQNQSPQAPPRTSANDSAQPSRVAAEANKPAFDPQAYSDLRPYIKHAQSVAEQQKNFSQTKSDVAARDPSLPEGVHRVPYAKKPEQTPRPIASTEPIRQPSPEEKPLPAGVHRVTGATQQDQAARARADQERQRLDAERRQQEEMRRVQETQRRQQEEQRRQETARLQTPLPSWHPKAHEAERQKKDQGRQEAEQRAAQGGKLTGDQARELRAASSDNPLLKFQEQARENVRARADREEREERESGRGGRGGRDRGGGGGRER